MAVNRFECVLSAVLHEDPKVVPQIIGFTTEMARAKLMLLLEGDALNLHGEKFPESRIKRSLTMRR